MTYFHRRIILARPKKDRKIDWVVLRLSDEVRKHMCIVILVSLLGVGQHLLPELSDAGLPHLNPRELFTDIFLARSLVMCLGVPVELLWLCAEVSYLPYQRIENDTNVRFG